MGRRELPFRGGDLRSFRSFRSFVRAVVPQGSSVSFRRSPPPLLRRDIGERLHFTSSPCSTIGDLRKGRPFRFGVHLHPSYVGTSVSAFTSLPPPAPSANTALTTSLHSLLSLRSPPPHYSSLRPPPFVGLLTYSGVFTPATMEAVAVGRVCVSRGTLHL